MENKKILISGTSTGLGKYLNKKFKAVKYKRKSDIKYYKKRKWDLIIHCGFYSGDKIDEYIECIKHTKLILQLNFKKIVFISSTAVYENQKSKREEKYNIYTNLKKSDYANTKIICENLMPKNSLILRLGTILGKEMRKNNIYKLLYNKKPKLSISKNSIYSFITYNEIFGFIKLALNKKLEGKFNFLRNDYTPINNFSKKINKRVLWGDYLFICTKAPNQKILKFINLNAKSSVDIFSNNAI